jgi:hypothetical protein
VPGRQVQAAPALAYFHIPEYSLLNTLNFTGIKQGEISPTSVNSEFLTTLAEMEDMKATFVGHDHVNTKTNMTRIHSFGHNTTSDSQNQTIMSNHHDSLHQLLTVGANNYIIILSNNSIKSVS